MKDLAVAGSSRPTAGSFEVSNAGLHFSSAVLLPAPVSRAVPPAPCAVSSSVSVLIVAGLTFDQAGAIPTPIGWGTDFAGSALTAGSRFYLLCALARTAPTLASP